MRSRSVNNIRLVSGALRYLEVVEMMDPHPDHLSSKRKKEKVNGESIVTPMEGRNRKKRRQKHDSAK